VHKGRRCFNFAPQTMLLKPKPLTLQGVYASLRAIALTKGPGSAQRKQDLIKQLISRCRCAAGTASGPTFPTSFVASLLAMLQTWVASRMPTDRIEQLISPRRCARTTAPDLLLRLVEQAGQLASVLPPSADDAAS
jgi:DNA ligase N terminus